MGITWGSIILNGPRATFQYKGVLPVWEIPLWRKDNLMSHLHGGIPYTGKTIALLDQYLIPVFTFTNMD